ncbi:MAG TPA: hypothetical protein PLP73_04385, partial [Candidatus Absconditabacterales bacterium]|nr:hypothetical protein [Candidatus Absconditabacterales bacterium]
MTNNQFGFQTSSPMPITPLSPPVDQKIQQDKINMQNYQAQQPQDILELDDQSLMQINVFQAEGYDDEEKQLFIKAEQKFGTRKAVDMLRSYRSVKQKQSEFEQAQNPQDQMDFTNIDPEGLTSDGARGIKGTIGTQEGGEFNDNIIPRVGPLAKYGGTGAPEAGKMIVNAPGSLYNVGADIGNMALNPFDTAKGLLGLIGGVLTNTGKGIGKFLSGKTEEEYNQIRENLINQGGVVGKIASIMESSEGMADSVRGALVERYGGQEQIAKTMTEDPIGIISDIASIVEGGATILSKGGKVAGSILQKTKYAKVGSKIGKVGDELSDIAKMASEADPYSIVTHGYVKGGKKAIGKASELLKNSVKGEKTIDLIASKISGMDMEDINYG